MFKNYDELISHGNTAEVQQKRRDVLDMLTAAVEAVNPYTLVCECLKDKKIVCGSKTIDLSDFSRLFLVSFGKASCSMGKAVCDQVPIARGIIITHEKSNEVFPENVTVYIGSHPVPRAENIQATEHVINLMKECGENDAVLVLISGGGSALLCKPRIPLKDVQQVYEVLLQCPATIQEVNTVRKHLSWVKGGQLVSACKGVVISLIISDVIGDSVECISSGPTAPDSTSFSDALLVIEKYNLIEKIPRSVRRLIDLGCKGKIPETLKKDNPMFDRVYHSIIGNNSRACLAVKRKAEFLGYTATILTTELTGEARSVGKELVTQIHSTPKKTVLICGGETTVSVKGKGRGGRNQELVLGCAEMIAGTDIVMASFATDGKDGTSDAAGALIDGWTLSQAINKGLTPQSFLDENNAYEFFRSVHGLLITGPTRTNVMDIQVVLH